MQTEPWNADLLDFLASDFAEHGYDVKHTLRLIANSAAYQSRCEVLTAEEPASGFQYSGPRAKRLTAEQFIDTVWQLTDAAPKKMDAKFLRGKLDPATARTVQLSGQWIWSSNNEQPAAAGERRTFRKRFELAEAPENGGATITCDNRFTLYINGKKASSGDNWQTPVAIPLPSLVQGTNELLIVAVNEGDSPNPAGLFFQASIGRGEAAQTIVSDTTWEWTSKIPKNDGKFAEPPEDWQPAVAVANQEIWAAVRGDLQSSLARAAYVPQHMMRAALLKSDPLMRTLGRPNRDQIVTMRPNDLSTLEAIDLANGARLAKMLSDGAQNLLGRQWHSRDELVQWLYRLALSRAPTAEERDVALELIGEELSQRGIEDLLWAVIMLPEYQFVR
jgi:hypothetical protein